MTDGAFDVAKITDERVWTEAIAAIGRHDFFHTFAFHRASQENGEGVPVAFVARENGRDCGLWPLMERRIPGTSRSDYSSAYGFGGPLVAQGADVDKAVAAMKRAMLRSGAVSLFSRMHPLFVTAINDESLRGSHCGDVIVIETGNGDTPPAGYRGSHRREIRQLVRAGYTVEVRRDLAVLDVFQPIYEAQMRQLGARENYYFDRSYFEGLLAAADFDAFVMVASSGGEPAAAAFFVVTGDIMQYFLSGTEKAFRKAAPTKLLISEAHSLATERGIRHLVLGGGVGSVRDALFKFKEGFSKVTYPYYLVREVLDPAAYQEICSDRGINPTDTPFFPAYRSVHA